LQSAEILFDGGRERQTAKERKGHKQENKSERKKFNV
jgi:hypothetical protein